MLLNMQAHSNIPFETRRIVIKLGTRILTEADGSLAKERLAGLVRQCSELISQGKELLIVSSGAVGLGRQMLQPQPSASGAISLVDKQACAAVGQNLLMDVYRELFGQYGLVTAQVLLTAADFSDRKRYLNLRGTLERLLHFNAVPIINENDTVSTVELEEKGRGRGFGDNDMLSALITSKLDADLLVILTNVDGVFMENPEKNPNAQAISRVESFEQLSSIKIQGQSEGGRGGMATKLEAARIASISGAHTLITSGFLDNPLADIQTLSAENHHHGTLILAQSALPGKKRWIGLASGYRGVVIINAGARTALVEKQASLLPIGIVEVQGEFSAGHVVSIQDEEGLEIGRGLIRFSAPDTQSIIGRSPFEDVVIHRDDLVIFQEYYT